MSGETNVSGHKHVWSQTCVSTNVSGHKRVWAQMCLGTNVSGHKCVWAQMCLGTNVYGHKRVWVQSRGLSAYKKCYRKLYTLIFSPIQYFYSHSKMYFFVIMNVLF